MQHEPGVARAYLPDCERHGHHRGGAVQGNVGCPPGGTLHTEQAKNGRKSSKKKSRKCAKKNLKINKKKSQNLFKKNLRFAQKKI